MRRKYVLKKDNYDIQYVTMIFAYDLLYHLVLVENSIDLSIHPHLRSSINITEYNYMYDYLFILLKKSIFKKSCFY